MSSVHTLAELANVFNLLKLFPSIIAGPPPRLPTLHSCSDPKLYYYFNVDYLLG